MKTKNGLDQSALESISLKEIFFFLTQAFRDVEVVDGFLVNRCVVSKQQIPT